MSKAGAVLLCGAMVAAAAVVEFFFETSVVDFPDLAESTHWLPFGLLVFVAASLILNFYWRGRGRRRESSHRRDSVVGSDWPVDLRGIAGPQFQRGGRAQEPGQRGIF